MAPDRSVARLNGAAIRNQAVPTPSTSPTTTHSAESPAAAPSPVSPRYSQADSPVARVENAATQYPSRFPPT